MRPAFPARMTTNAASEHPRRPKQCALRIMLAGISSGIALRPISRADRQMAMAVTPRPKCRRFRSYLSRAPPTDHRLLHPLRLAKAFPRAVPPPMATCTEPSVFAGCALGVVKIWVGSHALQGFPCLPVCLHLPISSRASNLTCHFRTAALPPVFRPSNPGGNFGGTVRHAIWPSTYVSNSQSR
jgi:hypothetical protein